jgi:integrase
MRIRVYKRGRRWGLDYGWGVDENGEPRRWRYTVSDTRKVADEIALAVAKEIEAGTFKGPAFTRVRDAAEVPQTFAVLAERWLALKAAKVRPSTLSGYHDEVLHLRVHFGEKWNGEGFTGTSPLVATIKPSECAELMADKLAQAKKRAKASGRLEGSPRTANKYMTTLRGILDLAVRDGIIPRNPADDLNAGKSAHAGRALTPAEIGATVAHVPPSDAWAVAVILAYWHTGTRRSELLGFDIPDPSDPAQRIVKAPLTWGEIDLETRTIKIPAARTKEKRDRVIGINDDLLAILKALPSRLRGAKDPSAPVFLDDHGQPPNPDRVYRIFGRAAEAAGIKGAIRLHDIRHSVGTMLADLGAAPHAIRDALGHSTLAMTNRYIQESQARASAALALLSGTLRAQKQA